MQRAWFLFSFLSHLSETHHHRPIIHRSRRRRRPWSSDRSTGWLPERLKGSRERDERERETEKEKRRTTDCRQTRELPSPLSSSLEEEEERNRKSSFSKMPSVRLVEEKEPAAWYSRDIWQERTKSCENREARRIHRTVGDVAFQSKEGNRLTRNRRRTRRRRSTDVVVVECVGVWSWWGWWWCCTYTWAA